MLISFSSQYILKCIVSIIVCTCMLFLYQHYCCCRTHTFLWDQLFFATRTIIVPSLERSRTRTSSAFIHDRATILVKQMMTLKLNTQCQINERRKKRMQENENDDNEITTTFCHLKNCFVNLASFMEKKE